MQLYRTENIGFTLYVSLSSSVGANGLWFLFEGFVDKYLHGDHAY